MKNLSDPRNWSKPLNVKYGAHFIDRDDHKVFEHDSIWNVEGSDISGYVKTLLIVLRSKSHTSVRSDC
jgi:hypothetical protein